MKNKFLILAIGIMLSTQTFGAVRFGSFYLGADTEVLNGVKDVFQSENTFDIFNKTKYKPDSFYNTSAEEISSVLNSFSDESRKKSYLNFLIKDYRFKFENNDKVEFIVKGNNNIINFYIYFKDDKYIQNPIDDLGFKKTICSSEINKVFLNNGAKFQAEYYLNEVLFDQKYLEGNSQDVCAQDFAKSINKKVVQKTNDENKEPKIELAKEEKKVEDKTKTIYIPKTLINNSFKYENGNIVEEKESDFTVVKIEEPQVEVKRIPQIVTLSEKEQQKILDLNQKNLKAKQKSEKAKEIINNINNIYKDLVEEDRVLFREHVASLMKKYYDDILTKKKKTSSNSTTTVSNKNENVVFNIKFSRNYSSIAKDSVASWKKSNEAKKFVCSDPMLSSMLEIGIKYEVRYADFRGNVFYSEKVDDITNCLRTISN